MTGHRTAAVFPQGCTAADLWHRTSRHETAENVTTSPEPTRVPPPGRRQFLCLALIILAGLLAYSNSLDGSFHYDDQNAIIVSERGLQSLSPLSVWRANNHWRFVGFYTYALNYRFGGLTDLAGWHAMNIALHLGCAVLVYFFMLQVTALARQRAELLPLFAALLFATHPLCSEPVNYIQARLMPLLTGFALGACLCLGVALTRQGWQRVAAAAGVLLCTLLACLTKEVSVLFVPAALGLYAVFGLRDRLAAMPARRKRQLAAGAGVLLVLAAVLLAWVGKNCFVITVDWRKMLFGSGQDGMHGGAAYSYFAYVLTQILVFWRYVFLLLPAAARLSVDHAVPLLRLGETADLLTALVAAGSFVGMTVLALWRLRTRPLPAFLFLWAVVALAPYMVVASSAQLMVEYKAYPAVVGLCGLVALGIGSAVLRLAGERGPVVLRLLAALVTVACIQQTRLRNLDWENDLTLWDHEVRLTPQRMTPYWARGVGHETTGNLEAAFRDYTQAIALAPKHPKAYYNRGLLQLRFKRLDEALADLHQAIALTRGNELSTSVEARYRARALIHQARNAMPEALADVNRALEIMPGSAESLLIRAGIHEVLGDTAAALRDYDKAIESNPSYVDALFNRGTVWLKHGKLDAAIADFSRAAVLSPQRADVFINRGSAYLKQGKVPQALADFDHGLALDPRHAGGYLNRALARLVTGNTQAAHADAESCRRFGGDIAEFKRLQELMRAAAPGP